MSYLVEIWIGKRQNYSNYTYYKSACELLYIQSISINHHNWFFSFFILCLVCPPSSAVLCYYAIRIIRVICRNISVPFVSNIFVCFSVKHLMFPFYKFTLRPPVSVPLRSSHYIWCDFDRASSLICGNKLPARCNRGFYCRSYCLLNMFRVPLCSSSGSQEYYTVVAACGIWCCGFQVAGLVWSWGLCVRFAGCCGIL